MIRIILFLSIFSSSVKSATEIDPDIALDEVRYLSMESLVQDGQIDVLRAALQHNWQEFVKTNLVRHGDSYIFKEIVENMNIQPSKIPQEACSIYFNHSVKEIDYKNTNASFDTDLNAVVESPWMAALGYFDIVFGIFTFSCGGALISDSFVLATAHCVEDSHRPDSVRIGTADISFKKNKNVFRIKNILKHPEYSTTTKENDIALIELMEVIYISNAMRPACLQTDERDLDPTVDLTAIEWGFNANDYRNGTESLLKISLKTMPKSHCNRTLFEFNQGKDVPNIANGIGENQYCAFEPNGKNGSCVGDSGGPVLMIGNGSVPTKVVGIVSFNVAGSYGTTLPSVYIRVTPYLLWIRSIVWPSDTITAPKINQAI